MSSRALRKAQREREELDRLQKIEQEEHEGQKEADQNTEKGSIGVRRSAFALLGNAEEDGEVDIDDFGGEEEDAKPQSDDENITSKSALPTSKPKKKKKKKKGKILGSNVDQGIAATEDDVDEIDAALRELSTGNNKSHTDSKKSASDTASEEACRLLAVDPNHLHAQNEMRRLFGRAALEQGGDGDDQQAQDHPTGGNRWQQRRLQQVGLAQALRGPRGQGGRPGGVTKFGLRRNLFIQGKEEWPVATGGGLGMEVVAKTQDGTVEYRYVHSRAYQDVQSQFEACVESMDPNRLVVLLQHNPYHISTLLQVSEIAKSERDHATSGDLLERALFSLGRAVHSTFAKSLSEGKARLDFRRPENREFWLASWRYMQNLGMRGTWRTVYEWAKLLLSLAPQDDPYCIWLVLDQYALRSRQDLDYLNLSRNLSSRKVHGDMSNVELSQGLAEFRAGNKNKGQQILYSVLSRSPWMGARLMQELNLDAPPALWGKDSRTPREKLHSELYSTRAKDIWNTPEMSSLLVEIGSAVPPEAQPAPPDTSEIGLNEARHVILSDTPSLIALIPRSFTTQLTSTSDPLPPPDSIQSYTTASTSLPATGATSAGGTPAENFRELQSLNNFFSTVFPWLVTRRDQLGDGAGELDAPSEEELEQRMQDAGIDENTVIERMGRMMELQRRLAHDHDGHGAGNATEDGVTEALVDQELRLQPQVEDASDDGL